MPRDQVCVHQVKIILRHLLQNARAAWQPTMRISNLRHVLRVPQTPPHTAWASLQGPKDIYLGMTGAVLGTIPTAFLYFSTYEWCKDKLAARGHSQVSPLCLAISCLVLYTGNQLLSAHHWHGWRNPSPDAAEGGQCP